MLRLPEAGGFTQYGRWWDGSGSRTNFSKHPELAVLAKCASQGPAGSRSSGSAARGLSVRWLAAGAVRAARRACSQPPAPPPLPADVGLPRIEPDSFSGPETGAAHGCGGVSSRRRAARRGCRRRAEAATGETSSTAERRADPAPEEARSTSRAPPPDDRTRPPIRRSRARPCPGSRHPLRRRPNQLPRPAAQRRLDGVCAALGRAGYPSRRLVLFRQSLEAPAMRLHRKS